MNKRVHIFISGKVQGVFFRQNTKQKSDEFGIKGWVKNLKDKRVEAVFEGKDEDIDKIIKWCEKGPEFSDVKKIEVISEMYEGKFKRFEILD